MTCAPSTVVRIRDLLPTCLHAADGGQVLSLVRRIVETDRWNSFDQFAKTAQTIEAAFAEAGAAPEHVPIPTGGYGGTGRWIVRHAMDISAATVEMVEPKARVLADYRQNPWCVVHWCRPTPPDGLTCDLRIVDSDDALAALPKGALDGAAVLTRQRPTGKHEPFARAGAAAVIFDCAVPDLPDATLWGKFGWGGLQHRTHDHNLPAFMVSESAGRDLRRFIEAGHRVVLRLRLDARHYDGEHHVVCGLLRGCADPQDEVWAVAHSSEPGAVDNASGVAVCIEAARILETLIEAGTVPRPRRTIRVVTAMECYGFFEYLIRGERLQPPLAGIVVDCVGTRAEDCKSTVSVHRTVPSSASFVDSVALTAFREAYGMSAASYEVRTAPFTSTEDTLLGDPLHGFPCPYVGSYPYRGYHSSADTPDRLDPASLEACAAAVATYLYVLADGDTAAAKAWYQASRTDADDAPTRDGNPADEASGTWFRQGQDDANRRRLRRWFWGAPDAELLESITPSAPGQLTATGDDRVPFRRLPLAPTYENMVPDLKQRILATKVHKWALYWADGNRTLEQIRHLAGAETGRELTREQIAAFFEAMHDAGVVTLVERHALITRDRLVEDLRVLGLKAGMAVMVHSSLSAIGWVQGGAETVIDALLEIVGPEGTLMMPSFNHRRATVFNPLTTPTTNGAIPDAFWRRPGVIRSDHPTHAVAACGPRAREWCADHTAHGVWAADSPIGHLVHNGGYILGLGVDHTASTAYHVGEVSLNVPCLDAFGSIQRTVNADGQVVDVRSLSWRDGACPVSPGRLTGDLDARGVQTRGAVGRAACVFCRAREVWRMRREHIRDACATCSNRPRHTRPQERSGTSGVA